MLSLFPWEYAYWNKQLHIICNNINNSRNDNVLCVQCSNRNYLETYFSKGTQCEL